MKGLQAPRGMQDWPPQRARSLQQVESALTAVFAGFTYEPVRLPMMESVELFKRSVGEATDIVEKEMFLLQERDGDGGQLLALRPEGTASCVRALLQQGLLFNQQQRVYYNGSMFRYERPQKGRYREFYQIGAEAFGFAGPDLDVELLSLGTACWRALGIAEDVRLELNSIGSSADRAAFGAALVDYLQPMATELDADSQRRLQANPLRILDSKNPQTQALLEHAPKLEDFINPQAQAHFQGVMELLSELGIQFTRNNRLVRGLDYYNNTVFEWITDGLGAQGTICAGGRYDGLVEQLGGKPTPAAGFAIGIERVELLCSQRQQPSNSAVDAYLCIQSETQLGWAHAVAAQLRGALPELKLRVHAGGGKLEKQLKRADACGAQVALIAGEREQQAQALQYKPLRRREDSVALALPDLLERLKQDVLNG
ncbi:MAG: histidine--tRNA ligase [Pseudomonadales bacterium]